VALVVRRWNFPTKSAAANRVYTLALVSSTSPCVRTACCLRLLVSSTSTCGDTACCLRLFVSGTSTCVRTAC